MSRADATVARLGGDEFVVLVEGLTDTDSVHHIAARLLETLRRPYIIDDAADSLVVTAASASPSPTRPTARTPSLYREADLALYRAKDSGRDQYALFDSALRLRVDARMDAENLLRRALADGLVTPFFQPLIDMGSGRISFGRVPRAHRAAQRRQVVPPADFVDVAEESGLIVELDARMFELGLRQFAAAGSAPKPTSDLHTVSNVSRPLAGGPTFVDPDASGDDGGTAFGRWCAEITERSLLAPSPAVIESLRRIAGARHRRRARRLRHRLLGAGLPAATST